ncbi:hypothetical protein ACSMFQ_16120 [Ectopseudomonas chengduensis]
MENNIAPSLETEIAYQRSQNIRRRILELYLWIFIGILISGRAIFEIVTYVAPPIAVVQERYFEFLVSIIVVIFPVLYRLIFNMLPLESIRRRREIISFEVSRDERRLNKNNEHGESLDDLIAQRTSSETSEVFLTSLALSSRQLAKNLYSRSGVYLLIGVLIAFSGLVFFYLQTTTLINQPDATSLLISLAPNFGILFFIEFIALFFLKQYKSAMDEFRYYESLQRSREETLALVKLINESGESLNVYELIEKCGFRSTSEKLETGQTTELLESKKLNKDEAEIFAKILDIVGKR